MFYEQCRLAVADDIAIVTIDRPPVNALSRTLRLELTDAFDSLGDRSDVRCIVLTGSGRVFCAGADIKERAAIEDRPGDHARLNRLVRELFYAVMDCPKPVIGAINGPAIRAGFALALCVDILVAAEGATFAMPEVDVGMAGGVKFLQRHLPTTMARWLMLSGARIPAAAHHERGVVLDVVPGPDLLEAA